MFSVVKFKSDSSVQVVPSSWLNIDKNKCKYPPGPNINIINVVKKCTAAKPAWPYLPVKFFKSSGKF